MGQVKALQLDRDEAWDDFEVCITAARDEGDETLAAILTARQSLLDPKDAPLEWLARWRRVLAASAYEE